MEMMRCIDMMGLTIIFYLFFQISKALWAGFGRETEGAQWTVSFLLDKIMSSLLAWVSEEKTMTDILHLLVTLVENKSR